VKLTKEQEERRTKILLELREAAQEVESKVGNYNAARDQAWADVEAAVEHYNTVRGEAEELRDEVVNDAQAAIGDKSENWQESDKGQEAASWVEEWENLELDELSVDEPDELSADEPSHADDLENLPGESG
jgi:ClpP class serine protease